jgi:hypothetical protein
VKLSAFWLIVLRRAGDIVWDAALGKGSPGVDSSSESVEAGKIACQT